jgi:hypothetical protein
MGIDYLLSGLKGNTEVYELNVSKCGFDDEDLSKICARLKSDLGISHLKIGDNSFENSGPLLDILIAKGKQLRYVDISSSNFDSHTLHRLPLAIKALTLIEELSLSGIISQNICLETDSIKALIDAIL